jgi:hypothetical protein
MPTLFINGNIKAQTFGNAVAAAQIQSQSRYKTGLSDIFVLQSPESAKVLGNHAPEPIADWRRFLREQHAIHDEIFTYFTVDLRLPDGFRHAARHLQQAICALDMHPEIFIDLTNGSSIYKFLMSTVAYLTGTPHIYVLEGIPRQDDFASPEILQQTYFELHNPSPLDDVGYAWLTDVRRFVFEAAKVSGLTGDGEEAAAFTGEMKHAVRNWFYGERNSDGAALGGAVQSLGHAFEQLIHAVCSKHLKISKARKMHETLLRLTEHLRKSAPAYEPALLASISDLLRTLRNASTHETSSHEFGRIRARLATELLLATTEYFRILQADDKLGPCEPVVRPVRIGGVPGRKYYFGLDGDDTGRSLEALFQRDSGKEVFRDFSRKVEEALLQVRRKVKESPLNGDVIFCTGDDILFEASFSLKAIEMLQQAYQTLSGGQTCSIGFGHTTKEAYLALKIAKAIPGKNAIFGVEIVDGAGTPS